MSLSKKLAVNVLQVGLESEVRAERVCANVLQLRKFEFGCDGKWHTHFAGNFGRIEQKKPVDDSCGKSGSIERRARFEEDTENLAAAEFGEDALQIDPASARADSDHFDAGF